MNDTRDELDQRLTRALEAVPRVEMAGDFAQRVMGRLPARPVARLAVSSASIGRRVAFVALFALVLAMFAVAIDSHAIGHVAYMTIQAIFAAEFILLTVWLSLRPQSVR